MILGTNLASKSQASFVKLKIKNKIFKTQTKYPKIFLFLICVFYIWSFIFGFSWSFAFSKAPVIIPKSPAVSAIDSFTFVVFGDNRDGDKIFMDLVAKVNQEEGIAFAVNTGDFVSHGRKSEYEKYLGMESDLKAKIYHVPGNHDLVGGGEKYFRKYFGHFYYSFDYRNSHFVILNNAFKRHFDAEQFEWLKRDLAKTKKENIFVFTHRPTADPTEIYKGYIMSGKKVIEELMGVFRRYKVDYVIAGHIHGYARAERDGTIYIVTGGAGAPLYLPKDFGGFYHYVKISVDGNKIKDKVVKIYE